MYWTHSDTMYWTHSDTMYWTHSDTMYWTHSDTMYWTHSHTCMFIHFPFLSSGPGSQISGTSLPQSPLAFSVSSQKSHSPVSHTPNQYDN